MTVGSSPAIFFAAALVWAACGDDSQAVDPKQLPKMVLQMEDLPVGSRVTETCGEPSEMGDGLPPLSQVVAFDLPTSSSSASVCLRSGVRVFDSASEARDAVGGFDSLADDYERQVEQSGGKFEAIVLSTVGDESRLWVIRREAAELISLSFSVREVVGLIVVDASADSAMWKERAVELARVQVDRMESALQLTNK